MSVDPLEYGGGDVNLYSYVWNSPTNFTDPTGLAVMPLPAGCSSRKWACSPALAMAGAGAGPLIGAAASAPGAAAMAAAAGAAARPDFINEATDFVEQYASPPGPPGPIKGPGSAIGIGASVIDEWLGWW